MISSAIAIDISVRAKVLGLTSVQVLDLCGPLGIPKPEMLCNLAEPDAARLAKVLGERAALGRAAARDVRVVESGTDAWPQRG